MSRYVEALVGLAAMSAEPKETPLMAALIEAGRYLDERQQPVIASLSALIGLTVGGYGALLVKAIFMVICACICGYEVNAACLDAGNPILSSWAPLVDVLVAIPTLRLWHHAYPGFVFLVGCSLGGSGIFFAARVLAAHLQPTSLLGAIVFAALLVGLAFLRYHSVGWRLLTPPLGGLCTAASVRYCISSLMAEDAMWSSFAPAMVHVPGAKALDFEDIAFWTAWAIAALIGWYLQLTPLVGLRDEPALLTHPTRWMCDHSQRVGVSPETVKRISLRQGLLEFSDKDSEQASLTPSSQRLSEDDGMDYKAEGAQLISLISVLVLNLFLSSKPILFVGHVVLCAAFLPLAGAGMVSYASAGLLLPRLFGPRVARRFTRHSTHAAFSALAVLCVLAGYACIVAAERPPTPHHAWSWQKKLHVWLGYLTMLLLLFGAQTGAVKLCVKVFRSMDVHQFHPKLGRIAYGCANINTIIGYSLPGILPALAVPAFAAVQIMTAVCTLYFLNAKHCSERRKQGLKELAQRYEQNRQRVAAEMQLQDTDKRFSITERRFSLNGVRPALSPSEISVSLSASGRSSCMPTRDAPPAAFLAAEVAIAKQYRRLWLQQAFTEWQCQVQDKRLREVEVALKSQDRLVQFMAENVTMGGLGGTDAA